MSKRIRENLLAGSLLTAAICFSGPLSASPAARAPAATSAVAPPTRVTIGNFTGKAVQNSRYGTLVPNHGAGRGWGWAATTDQMAGGHSVARISLIRAGAAGTAGALHIEGEIKPGFPFPWAGAIWFPGHEPMHPGNLSAYKVLTFWARGKSGRYTIMLETGSPGGTPQDTAFVMTPHWKQYRINLNDRFPDADLKQVYYIAFSADNSGNFQFDLDQVVLH